MKKRIFQIIILLISCCLTAIILYSAIAEEPNTKSLFEQTCCQLEKDGWLPENFATTEYSENELYEVKYEAKGDGTYFDLTVDKNHESERFAFQLKSDEPLEDQINVIFHSVFPDAEDQGEFASSLLENYTKSMTFNGKKPYAQKWYNQQRCELDMGWLYIWLY